MPDTPTFGRYAEIPVERMTAEQQSGYRLLVDGPRGRLPGPYCVWVYNHALTCSITRQTAESPSTLSHSSSRFAESWLTNANKVFAVFRP